jgi:type IX secretion system PorP/SprF family membrane protein
LNSKGSYIKKLPGIRRAVIILAFGWLVGQGLMAQVPDSSRISLGYPVYSQYLQNGLMINPAYAGSRDALSAFLSYRMQWMGTPGAPQLQSLSLHTPMKNDRVGLGLKGGYMTYGRTKLISIYGIYAYHIRVGRGKLSFGLQAGADMSNTNYAGLILLDELDPVFTSEDKPYILPNAGAGLYYFSEKLFAGVSVPAFLRYRRTDTGSTQAYHSFSDYDFLISAGGLISFSDAFKFKPSVLVEYSLQKTKKLNQLDINGNFIIADLIWVGASWRTSEEVAVGIIQVFPTPQLMIGLSYDYPVGRMNTYSKGSTEVTLRYEFGSRVSAANPRYF